MRGELGRPAGPELLADLAPAAYRRTALRDCLVGGRGLGGFGGGILPVAGHSDPATPCLCNGPGRTTAIGIRIVG